MIGWAESAENALIVPITSYISCSWKVALLAEMLTSTPRASAMLTSSSSGHATACSAASRARSAPAALAEPIIAMPISAITVRTSAKSTLIMPGQLMISAMPATAPCSTSLAALNASSSVTWLPSTSISLSLGTTISESTWGESASMPSCAMRWRLPSNANGLVTTATVRMPSSLASLGHHRRRAGTGAAAHARRQEQHVGAGDDLGDALAVFQRRLAPDFGIGARAQPLGDAGAELQLDLGLVALQRLRVGVGGDELHPLHAFLDHVVDRIAAAAAHADHLDYSFLRLCIHYFKHELSPLDESTNAIN